MLSQDGASIVVSNPYFQQTNASMNEVIVFRSDRVCVGPGMDAEYRLSAKRVELNVLEVEIDDDKLWDHDEYQKLKSQISDLKKEVNSADTANSERANDQFESISVEAGD